MKLLRFKKFLGIKDYRGANMVLAFTVLRFIATCLITNTHYDTVYPISGLAVGGLLGDVLFFVVSGFVLAIPTTKGFFSWYGKRVLRIYPAIVAGVVFYLLTGYKALGNWFEAFVFPTFFVFTAAIILLYIPFYFVNKIDTKRTFLLVSLGWIVLWTIVYVFLFDKSTYEMNNTWNPMIAFPYFTSMLFGAYLRKFVKVKPAAAKTILCFVAGFVFLVTYFFATKLVRANEDYFSFQIIVQATLLIGVGFFVYFVYRLDDWFKKWPSWLLASINFVATFTLEIYVIQKPIIKAFSGIIFPVNWIVITAVIILSAICLRIAIEAITVFIKILFSKINMRKG